MTVRTLVGAAAAALLVSAPGPSALEAQAHAHTAEAAERGPSGGVPLYDDLGDLHHPVTVRVEAAQAYFDQGLRLYYAFNHQEAIRSFREAQRLDPACAMCWWGEALAWGPNINLLMDSASGAAAHAAIEEARARASGVSEKERALIEALSLRYAPVPPEVRAPLDSAYSRAMADLADRFPEDDDVAVLFGESVMVLSPWDYWTPEVELRPGMKVAVGHFERILERSPDHPGACHFFIHAVEKEQPERAVPCAERLAALMPGAGHIVHMPGHIYIRVGRYLDAVRANEHAAHADETYIQDQRPGMGIYTAGYYPHNYDFLAFAAMMIGREEQAVEAADKVGSLIPEELFGQPGMNFAEHYAMRGFLVRTRFERWDEILAAPAPREELLHARAIWRYARGRALAGTGDVEAARAELARLKAVAEGPELRGVRLEFNESQAVLAIGVRVLEGRIAEAEGRYGDAAKHLGDGVRLQDALLYGEPPDWTVPVRQELGEVLLAAGRHAEAEAAFRGDLKRFPDNGWSLRGLAAALTAQGREAEAREVNARFREVWSPAEVDR